MFPEHIEISIAGSSPLIVLPQEVGRQQSESVGVGGPLAQECNLSLAARISCERKGRFSSPRRTQRMSATESAQSGRVELYENDVTVNLSKSIRAFRRSS